LQKLIANHFVAMLIIVAKSAGAEEIAHEKKSKIVDEPMIEELQKNTNSQSDNNYLQQSGRFLQNTVEEITNTFSESRNRRNQNNYQVLVNYSPIDLLIPSKYGFTLSNIQNVDQTWEFEYLRGSVSVPFIVEDLGKMTDERYSIIGRSYFGNRNFNLSYGFSYFDFSLQLGDKLLNKLSGGSYPSIDLVKIQSLGVNFAIGHRWSFDHDVTFGIDWISWAQPVYIARKQSAFLDYASNQQDKDDVDQATKIISYFPRLTLLKLQLGILF